MAPIPLRENESLADRLLLWLKIAINVVLLIGVAWALSQGNVLEAVLIVVLSLISLSPIYISRQWSIELPAEFEILAIVFIYSTLLLGEVGDFYNRFWWWDAVLHTSSGFMLGLVAFILVFTLNRNPNVHLELAPFFVCLFAFCFAVAAGALWEIFEYAMDGFVGTNMQKSGLVDTMWDLIVDTIGASAVSLLGYGYLRYGRYSFVNDMVQSFLERNPGFFKKLKARKPDAGK